MCLYYFPFNKAIQCKKFAYDIVYYSINARINMGEELWKYAWWPVRNRLRKRSNAISFQFFSFYLRICHVFYIYILYCKYLMYELHIFKGICFPIPGQKQSTNKKIKKKLKNITLKTFTICRFDSHRVAVSPELAK